MPPNTRRRMRCNVSIRPQPHAPQQPAIQAPNVHTQPQHNRGIARANEFSPGVGSTQRIFPWWWFHTANIPLVVVKHPEYYPGGGSTPRILPELGRRRFWHLSNISKYGVNLGTGLNISFANLGLENVQSAHGRG